MSSILLSSTLLGPTMAACFLWKANHELSYNLKKLNNSSLLLMNNMDSPVLKGEMDAIWKLIDN